MEITHTIKKQDVESATKATMKLIKKYQNMLKKYNLDNTIDVKVGEDLTLRISKDKIIPYCQ